MNLADHDIEIITARVTAASIPASLAHSLAKLAAAVEQQTRVLELLTEGMKPSTEAAITGRSRTTVWRHRKARKLQKLLS